MAIFYTLRFAEGRMSSSDFRLFERRVAGWMERQWRYDFCHPEADQSAMADLRAGELPQASARPQTEWVRHQLAPEHP